MKLSRKQAPYLSFSTGKAGAPSLIIKAAALKNTEYMRTKTVQEHREIITKLSEVRPVPAGIYIEPAKYGDVPCEWIWKHGGDSGKVIMYIHGGSWIHGNLKTAQAAGILLAEAVSCRILTVDYRLSPEHPFPAGLDDCLEVFDALLETGYAESDIALFGDSAGGNLSLALMQVLKSRGRALPCAAGLVSPVPDITGSSEIIKSCDNLIYTLYDGAESDIFTLYARGNAREDPLLSPLYGDLTGFPPILIHAGGDEPLSLDCVAFARKAYEQGVDVSLKVYRDMFHNFSIVGAALKESRASIKEFGQFFTKWFT